MRQDWSELTREVVALLGRTGVAAARLDADTIPALPEEEARLIVADAVRTHPDDPGTRAREVVARRQAGELLGHVLGRVTFLNCELLTAPDCLVPRRETEILGRAAIAVLQGRAADTAQPMSVIDMCCGGGNLACAVAHHVPQARVWAADLTDGCVRLALRNVAHLELERRVTVHQGNLFGALGGLGLEGQVDVVICNPPYISTGRLGGDRAELLAREPREAFDGGPYGLSIHQRVIRDALEFLHPDGWLMFEIGVGQHRQLELLFRRSGGAYGPVRWENDTAGNPRAAIVQRIGTNHGNG